MGWFGYNIYDGDETQTRHLDFCKWAGLYKGDGYDWMDQHLTANGTILDKEECKILLKNINFIIKKMPKSKFWNDEKALDWQMLGALFLDNKLKIPKLIKENTILGTEYLMGEHAADFTNPSRRRRYLRKFIQDIKKL